MAPEVLQQSYTDQCDLWSAGVIAFTLMSGSMPFSGSDRLVATNILQANYTMRAEKWDHISALAQDFVKSLLEENPETRLTAQAALEHPWLSTSTREERLASPERSTIDMSVVDALRQFGQAAEFRRCCLEVMAWSLSNEERASVRQYFVSMIDNQHGTVTRVQLKKLLQEMDIASEETDQICNALGSNKDGEIEYSEFLAAMVGNRLDLHDELLRATFKRFDTNNSGYITAGNLSQVMGGTFGGMKIRALMAEADFLQDSRVSYPEFKSYLRGDPLTSPKSGRTVLINHGKRCPNEIGCLRCIPSACLARALCTSSAVKASKSEPSLSTRSGGMKETASLPTLFRESKSGWDPVYDHPAMGG
jgi:Ca2+-binding EF-hand superfamily protein